MVVRALIVLVSTAAVASAALPALPLAARPPRYPHRLGANGPLLALYARGGGIGGLGTSGPAVGDGQILALRGGTVLRVLARGLPAPFSGGLAPAPQGRYIAYGEDANPAAGPNAPSLTQGLWSVTSDGRTARRLLQPPHSLQGNTFGIGPIAWSPDQDTLAYAVNNVADYAADPQQDRGLGIWLTRFDQPSPRLVATLPQLGLIADGSSPVTQLSWTPDGHTLAISAARPGAAKGQSVPVVLSFDVRTAKERLLVTGGDAAFASTGGALAYVTGGAGAAPMPMTLWRSDAQGHHARKIISVSGAISSPTWSPDARTIAYIESKAGIGAPTIIHLVDVASGRDTIALRSTTRRPLFTPGGRFLRLAWMLTSS